MSTVWGQFKSTWPTTLFSGVLFLAVTHLLLWNEFQAILNSQSLDEVRNNVVSIDPYNAASKAEYEGKLVHLLGSIDIMEPLTEPDYNIQVLSVKLRKRVQMYQWIEEAKERDDFGDSMDTDPDVNKYSYYKDWRDFVVDSNLFYITPGHHNPKDMPISGQTFTAENVKIGWVFLGSHMKRHFSDYYDITSDERPERQDIKLHSGAYYHAADSLVHEIGDLRVIFSYAGRQDDEYSAIGLLQHSTIQPYVTRNQEPLAILRKGRHSVEDMIKLAFKESRMIVWLYRAVGWFQMFAAAMSLHPGWFTLLMNAKWVSVIKLRTQGRIKVNLIFTTCATLLIIAAAWSINSPLLSLTMFIAGISPFFYFSNIFDSSNLNQCRLHNK